MSAPTSGSPGPTTLDRPLTPIERLLDQSIDDFAVQPPPERAQRARAAVSDLHFFLDEGREFEERDAPELSRTLARSLFDALRALPSADSSLTQRIVTDSVLREECDRDQNVYLGKFFTRRLSQAVPDLLFLPATAEELAGALGWARAQNVPATLRGAGSTAMGGAIPAQGGIVIDLAKLDRVTLGEQTVRFGAGVRMRPLHRVLNQAGLALPAYPSNLGGTYAGWLATGGIGMNAYGHGRALDAVHSAQVVLPDGRLVRLHADGEAEIHENGTWRGAPDAPLTLNDLAGSEGQFGALVELEVQVEPLPDLAGFLLAFDDMPSAIAAVDWVGQACASGMPLPADVKLLTGSHIHHVHAIWREEDAKHWRQAPSAHSRERELPWRNVLEPAALGATVSEPGDGEAPAYLFVDMLSEADGRAFVERLGSCPGSPRVSADSRRFTLDRFRPQQVKRLGPGFLAAEILMPAARVADYHPAAEKLAENAGTELDLEVYYLADGTALAIAGYLTDHRKGSFHVDLLLAPALLDLAISKADARPYVLGRWQANLLSRKFGAQQRDQLTKLKEALDPGRIVNRGAFFAMGLRTPLGKLLEATMGPAVRIMRTLVSVAPPVAKLTRKWMQAIPGPAAGRGDALAEQALDADIQPSGGNATGRAIHCVNCGECNSVCPIFQESQVRLPQILTHLGEALHGGEGVSESATTLLDLCMRCGNCEEVCQSGIPHLPLYDAMQKASNKERPYRRDRHVLLLERLRSSEHYTGQFLEARPGGYIKRTPAALPGEARFQLLRAEGEAGPAETCIHCGACVDVCPTNANREYEADDPRLITTVQSSCIGCGTCVEVCPANVRNGGRTLRVMEAPTLDWFDAVADFAACEKTR